MSERHSVVFKFLLESDMDMSEELLHLVRLDHVLILNGGDLFELQFCLRLRFSMFTQRSWKRRWPLFLLAIESWGNYLEVLELRDVI
jgi:hypothetical protein